MDFQDYYQTLGVPRTASQADIKKAFRKLAREHHPDKKPGDKAAEARFKEINEANAVLSDPDKRKKYDRLGKDWEAYSRAGVDPDAAGSPFGGANPFAGFGRGGGAGGGPNIRYEFRTSGGGGGADFSDFFRTFFGADAGPASGGAGGPRVRRGPDERTVVRRHPRRDGPDQRRGGVAAGPGRAAADADRASAAGRATAEAVAEIDLEEAYQGTTRRVEIDGRRLDVTIPRGADDGTKIKLSGQGPRRRRPRRHHPGPAPPVVHANGRRSRARAAADPRGGAARRGGAGHDAQGQGPPARPGRNAERPSVPAEGPGPAPPQGRRIRRPLCPGPCRPPTDARRRGGRGRPRVP